LLGEVILSLVLKAGRDLVFGLPEVPADWQFLIDIIPAQMAAKRL
jgi:hypothetical protein